MMNCEKCKYSVNETKGHSSRCKVCVDYNLFDEIEHESVLTLEEDKDDSPETPPAIYQILLKALLGDLDMAIHWWNTSNKAFNGKTPAECHSNGGADEMNVARYLIGMLHR